MPDLRLTPDDQRLLADALNALLSPLDYADADAWRRAVCRGLKPLFHSEIATFILPRGGRVDAFNEDLDTTTSEYLRSIEPFARRAGAYDRMRGLPVIDRATLWGEHLAELYQTSYWNDFLRPNRAFDSLTVTASLGSGTGFRNLTQLILNRDSPHAPPFTQREISLGYIVLSALRAGAVTWLRLGEHRCALAVEVDALAVPLFLFDAEGRELHRNAALTRALAGDEEAEAVAALAGRLATAARRIEPGHALEAAEGGGGVEGETRTRRGGYRLRAARVGPAVTGLAEGVAVTVERTLSPAGPPLPAEGALRERWGLTRQQARVALLLAERKTNREVAEALCVSAHTARHHVEAVLAKLGVGDRLRVRERLLAR